MSEQDDYEFGKRDTMSLNEENEVDISAELSGLHAELDVTNNSPISDGSVELIISGLKVPTHQEAWRMALELYKRRQDEPKL